jgi:HAMP domain-containing protein
MELTTTNDGSDEYEKALAEIRTYVHNRPDELVRRSTVAMEGLREQHSLRRVELEVDHQGRMQTIASHYDAKRNEVNTSIMELERQLGQMRNEWERLGNEKAQQMAEERDRWERADRDQRKLIEAEQAMIDRLKS